MSEQEEKESVAKTSTPLVFISHDTRDAELAEAFSNLLRSVSAGVLKSFRSSDRKGNQGIEYGVEWYPSIIKNIQAASDVVCLLTERSVDRPWILFEAGMAKGKLETPILGVALGMPLNKASTGPFAQFQNCGDDEDSLCKLVFQLVDRIPNSEPDEETISFQVNKFKKAIEVILKKQSGNTQLPSTETASGEESSAKLFEEIKVMFQDLPARIERNFDGLSRDKKRRKFHPIMIEELIHMTKIPDVGVMMCVSFFKDSYMPWVYDIGMDIIKFVKSPASIPEKEQKIQDFEEILEMSMHHPMIREFSMGTKDEYLLFREMLRFLIKSLHRLLVESDKT